PLRLRPRIHRFLRGLARFWRCTNPTCGQLLDEGIETCDQCGARTLPLAICRTCGWDFFVAQASDGDPVLPWRGRVSGPQTYYLYDSPATHFDIDSEEDPLESEEEEEAVPIAENQEDAIDGETWALCPRCLVVSETQAARTCTCGDRFPLRTVRLH